MGSTVADGGTIAMEEGRSRRAYVKLLHRADHLLGQLRQQHGLLQPHVGNQPLRRGPGEVLLQAPSQW